MASDTPAVVNPITGELLEGLDTLPAAVLADALYSIRERKTQMRDAEKALETELRRRIGMRERTVFIYGGYEVTAKPEWRREWDVDELETTLRELLDQGAVQAGELTEVIHHRTVVSGQEAARLLTRLSGKAHEAVERCFRWRQLGPARVQVERSVELVPSKEA